MKLAPGAGMAAIDCMAGNVAIDGMAAAAPGWKFSTSDTLTSPDGPLP